ncbi:MAG: prepilin-type N-terminal cleavage/methylation domain-containing protein [Candidatus Acidiferrales bacterium]
MKRQAGFSVIELMVATAILVIAVAATLSMLTQAIHANQGVTLMADTQENLRAAMNYMVRDILQAGDGIPQGGITIPNTGITEPTNAAPPNGQSSVNRPGLPALTFPTSYIALPAITPGPGLGENLQTPSPTAAGVTLTGPPSDTITVIYEDNTLLDENSHTLSQYDIYLAPPKPANAGCAAANTSPSPAGSMVLAANSLTVTFDPTCIDITSPNTGIHAGDLIYLQNASGKALMYVSNVAGQVVTFSTNDPFNINFAGMTSGTVAQMETSAGSGTFAPTTAMRIWMVTYYLDTVTNPLHPELMRQVNFNPAEPVGEVIEDLTISYDLIESGLTPPINSNQRQPVYPDTTSQIRKVTLFLAARSENAYHGETSGQLYFRNNLATEVNIRSLSFLNQFVTSGTTASN